jgi:hypothetical protein
MAKTLPLFNANFFTKGGWAPDLQQRLAALALRPNCGRTGDPNVGRKRRRGDSGYSSSRMARLCRFTGAANRPSSRHRPAMRTSERSQTRAGDRPEPDLRDRRVGVGSSTTATTVIAELLLESSGVGLRGVDRELLPCQGTQKQLSTGELDAAFPISLCVRSSYSRRWSALDCHRGALG